MFLSSVNRTILCRISSDQSVSFTFTCWISGVTTCIAGNDRRRALDHDGVSGAGFHRVRQQRVNGVPGLPHFRCESSAQATLKRPQQRATNRYVVMFCNAIRGVPRTERLQRRHELVKPIETFDGKPEHLHQLATLLLEVASEEAFETWIELEQAPVEQCCCHIGDGFHLLEAGLHQTFLFPCHLFLSFSRDIGRAAKFGAKLQASLKPITTYAGRKDWSSVRCPDWFCKKFLSLRTGASLKLRA